MKILALILATILLLASLILLAPPAPAFAQDQPPLTLRMSRDFGYSSGAGKIQGTFTLKASAPVDLQRVAFFLDGALLGEVIQPPFELRFHTGNYSLGIHTLTAVGYTPAGDELQSNVIRVEFVSADEGWQAGLRILGPLLAIIAAAMLLSLSAALFSSRRYQSLPAGTPRKYGFSGGAVCPNCGRPFPLHVFGLNLGLRNKFDRCPFCGKWAVMHRRSVTELRDAEQAEIKATKQAESLQLPADEDRLRKELEDSRYQDL